MPLRRALRFAVCLAAVSLLIPNLLSAQGTSGRIVGRVSDAAGAVLPNVKVTLVNEGVWPDTPDQFFLAHDAVAVLHQMDNEIEHLGLERDWHIAPAQLPRVGIKYLI